MYETKMRPIDVVKLRYEDIYDAPGGVKFIEYVPEKLKHHSGLITQSPLNEKALAIAIKYKGRSVGIPRLDALHVPTHGLHRCM